MFSELRSIILGLAGTMSGFGGIMSEFGGIMSELRGMTTGFGSKDINRFVIVRLTLFPVNDCKP